MSEDSLLSSAAAEVNESQQEAQSQEIQNEIAQETSAPALERPEWLQDRYLAGNRGIEDAIAEQAKGYNELRKQLGGFTGAPEEDGKETKGCRLGEGCERG